MLFVYGAGCILYAHMLTSAGPFYVNPPELFLYLYPTG
jgi:hypothetical protein